MKKTIAYNRETRDFAAYVDGILIGYYRTHLEAENACNDYTFETLRRAA